MACYLRVGGKDFDIDSYLREHPVEAAKIHRKGEPEFSSKANGPKKEHSGLNIIVSIAECDDFEGQIKDALEFLEDSDNSREIKILLSYPGVEAGNLDFGVELMDTSETPIQYYSFPPELLRLAGNLKLCLEISLYAF